MSNNERDPNQPLPFDQRQFLAQLLSRKGGTDLSSALGDVFLSYVSGNYVPEPRLSEGELFQRYAPEFLYITENEPPNSWKVRAASSLAQGVPAYVVKDNLRQELLANPEQFGMSTSKEIDDLVDNLGRSYQLVQTKAIEQAERKDPFQKAGYPGAEQGYSEDDIFRMGAKGFGEILGRVSPDSPVQRALAQLQQEYAAAKAALPPKEVKPTEGAVVSKPRTGDEVSGLQSQYDLALEAAKAGKPFSYGGKTYSGRQVIDELLPMLQEKIGSEQAADKAAKDAAKSQENEWRNEYLRNQKTWNATYGNTTRLRKKMEEDFKKYSAGQMTEQEYLASVKAVEESQKILNQLEERNKVLFNYSRKGGPAPGPSAAQKAGESDGGQQTVVRPDGKNYEKAMVDWWYKTKMDIESRKKGGEKYAAQEAQMFFDKIVRGLQDSGRTPLMDALLNAAILKRGMGGYGT